MGVFLRQLDGTVVSIRKKKTNLLHPLFQNNLQIRVTAQTRCPPKKWKSPISRSKGVFCEQFFFTISKTLFDPTCKKSGSYMPIITVEI